MRVSSLRVARHYIRASDGSWSMSIGVLIESPVVAFIKAPTFVDALVVALADGSWSMSIGVLVETPVVAFVKAPLSTFVDALVVTLADGSRSTSMASFVAAPVVAMSVIREKREEESDRFWSWKLQKILLLCFWEEVEDFLVLKCQQLTEEADTERFRSWEGGRGRYQTDDLLNEFPARNLLKAALHTSFTSPPGANATTTMPTPHVPTGSSGPAPFFSSNPEDVWMIGLEADWMKDVVQLGTTNLTAMAFPPSRHKSRVGGIPFYHSSATPYSRTGLSSSYPARMSSSRSSTSSSSLSLNLDTSPLLGHTSLLPDYRSGFTCADIYSGDIRINGGIAQDLYQMPQLLSSPLSPTGLMPLSSTAFLPVSPGSSVSSDSGSDKGGSSMSHRNASSDNSSEGSDNEKRGEKRCSRCQTTNTPLWRRSSTTMQSLCNRHVPARCAACAHVKPLDHASSMISRLTTDDDVQHSTDYNGPSCSNCASHKTCTWRRHPTTGARVCNPWGFLLHFLPRGREYSLGLCGLLDGAWLTQLTPWPAAYSTVRGSSSLRGSASLLDGHGLLDGAWLTQLT
ncbi:hypothetical protein FISHEDRAFT_58107 [Fistulina hepatica ATCC 64428]|uniref:GATA-type domain-containing protein n=1 Tax=Fistulina hepatica ATCC 64428 TaxID=1128425 RepID=A0A0D7AFF9_9AGAR|nr:hypothetical protein FISHEDRAFT_58107 [Fistulina hepatica ATCC 64428]